MSGLLHNEIDLAITGAEELAKSVVNSTVSATQQALASAAAEKNVAAKVNEKTKESRRKERNDRKGNHCKRSCCFCTRQELPEKVTEREKQKTFAKGERKEQRKKRKE